MNRIVKISDSAIIAIHALAVLAAKPEQWRSTGKLARSLGCSAHTLSMVMQTLQKRGLVKAVRGPRGGYMLAKNSERISLLEIYRAIDGESPSEDCWLKKRICPGKNCLLGDFPETMSDRFRDYLAKTKLSQIAFRPTV